MGFAGFEQKDRDLRMMGLRINGDRFWTSLHDMAQIGATEKGGVCRLALSDLDKQAREELTTSCEALGMQVRFDVMGNQFARYPGKNPEARPILIGSHLDSQPTGGKYDGALGVLTALEVVRTLADSGIQLDHPIELVNWTNEEGARFAPAMIASGVFAGVFDLETAHSITDENGISIKDALIRIGHLGPASEASSYHASLELHIEQGPILEQKRLQIGIVTGVQGARWYECRVKGRAAHAGTTPMDMRVDPIQTTSALLQDCYQKLGADPEAKITVGTMKAIPGSINTVPEEVVFNLDLRHPKIEGQDLMEERFHELIRKHGSELIELNRIWNSAPVVFHPACIDAVTEACEQMSVSSMPIMSGAGHDSVYINRVTPTGMIFIPCKDGISHNEAESIEKADAFAGANVLLQSVLNLDRQAEIPFNS